MRYLLFFNALHGHLFVRGAIWFGLALWSLDQSPGRARQHVSATVYAGAEVARVAGLLSRRHARLQYGAGAPGGRGALHSQQWVVGWSAIGVLYSKRILLRWRGGRARGGQRRAHQFFLLYFAWYIQSTIGQ